MAVNYRAQPVESVLQSRHPAESTAHTTCLSAIANHNPPPGPARRQQLQAAGGTHCSFRPSGPRLIGKCACDRPPSHAAAPGQPAGRQSACRSRGEDSRWPPQRVRQGASKLRSSTLQAAVKQAGKQACAPAHRTRVRQSGLLGPGSPGHCCRHCCPPRPHALVVLIQRFC